ncbi:hypothetical protein [Actinacidiphila sp. ITFR-21]|uniref:hypothetical protein n=1 Tax=Actinacidiphila sp. ITFR-21 TaxID=3075199 RepID=UPI00288C3449|nr:hypothetical protein [Streptomyces sp. ITFR-21]WNI19982.1 hypothetical protein RLT57_31060 [Streptomyces sp. ITFR-21]
MDTTAAALQAGVTTATIRTWCRTGVIAAQKAGRRWTVDAASLAHRIAIAAMRRTRKATPMTEPAAALPWDRDHPEAADLNRLVASGITVQQILDALGSDAQGMGRYRPFTGRSRRWLDDRLTDIALRAQDAEDRAQAQRAVNLATPARSTTSSACSPSAAAAATAAAS